jgi:hypothetical protein
MEPYAAKTFVRRLSRRTFLKAWGLALSALPLQGHLPPVRRATLFLHMDRLLVTDTSDRPYVPRGFSDGARALAALSDADLRCLHPFL